MADFNPSPHDRLTIGGYNYQVMPHPAVPTFAFGQEGRKAFVFQLSGGPDHGLYALKKFKKAFRLPELVEINNKLARFAQWPGLEVCNRVCLQPGKHTDVLDQYPDLEYAVLMPWIGGSTWYDMVIGMTPLTRLEALAYANATAQVLAALEEASLAHCDISAANVIINPNTNRAHLIDIEDLYAPGFNPPASKPAGTDGYAHRQVRAGYWGPQADRFSGAVIISEMAAWHVPEIRKQAEEEHYFAVDEMQQDTAHYQLMHQALGDISPNLADLLEAAWFSDTLADAPPLKAWQETVSEAFQRENVARVAPEWRSLTLPGAGQQEEPPQPRPPLNVEPPAEPQPVELEEEPEEEPQAAPEPPAQQPSVVQAATPPAPPPAAAQRATPAPAAPQPPSPASRPIQVQTSPQTGGPVVEWRPLNVPQPAEEQAPPTRNGWGTRPIMPPAEQAEPEEPAPEPPAPEAEPEPEPEAEAQPDLIDEAEDAVPVESVAPWDEDEPALYDEPPAPPLPSFDEPVYEDEPVEYGDEVAEDYGDEVADDYPAEAPADDHAYQAGLLKPLLDLTHIDDRNRPHLVWTESPGAEVYVLQEDDNPHFRAPKEYTVKGHNDTRWSPPPWPLWRRTGRLYYRLRAEAAGDAGPWSDVLQVRIGRG